MCTEKEEIKLLMEFCEAFSCVCVCVCVCVWVMENNKFLGVARAWEKQRNVSTPKFTKAAVTRARLES